MEVRFSLRILPIGDQRILRIQSIRNRLVGIAEIGFLHPPQDGVELLVNSGEIEKTNDAA